MCSLSLFTQLACSFHFPFPSHTHTHNNVISHCTLLDSTHTQKGSFSLDHTESHFVMPQPSWMNIFEWLSKAKNTHSMAHLLLQQNAQVAIAVGIHITQKCVNNKHKHTCLCMLCFASVHQHTAKNKKQKKFHNHKHTYCVMNKSQEWRGHTTTEAWYIRQHREYSQVHDCVLWYAFFLDVRLTGHESTKRFCPLIHTVDCYCDMMHTTTTTLIETIYLTFSHITSTIYA